MSFLKKWTKKIQKYLFTYKDGFFIFPIFSADPDQLVEGLKNTPMVKYDGAKQYANAKTPFINADTYFQLLEDGLWIIYTSIVFKKNICFEMVYNPEKTANYYALAVDTSSTAKKSKHYLNDGRYIENQSYCWRLVKPGTIASNYNLGDTKSQIISIYLHKDWFQKYFLDRTNADEEILRWHQDPDRAAIFFPNSSLTRVRALEGICSQFEKQN